MIVVKSKHNENVLVNRSTNECPTTDIHISCNECPYECKLRMETTINIEEVYAQPEPLLTEIYY